MYTAQEIKTEICWPKEVATLFKVEEKEMPSFIKKTVAIELFREKKVSLGKAAQIAGISKEEMLGVLAVQKIPIHYSVKDLHQDVAA